MRSWTKRDLFTYLILFVLLFTRIAIADLALFFGQVLNLPISSAIMASLRVLQDKSLYFYSGYSFILIAIVIFVNRSDLKKLNINKSFIIFFVCGGLAFSSSLAYDFKPGWQLSLATALILLFVCILALKGWLKYGDAEKNLAQTMVMVLFAFSLGLFYITNGASFQSENSAMLIL
jgi:hypothetical protein